MAADSVSLRDFFLKGTVYSGENQVGKMYSRYLTGTCQSYGRTILVASCRIKLENTTELCVTFAETAVMRIAIETCSVGLDRSHNFEKL